MKKTWFILGLLSFMMSQAVLTNMEVAPRHQKTVNITICAFRIINYGFSMLGMAGKHGKTIFKEYRAKQVVKAFGVPVPEYLKDRYQQASFSLLMLLLVMLAHEPLL